MKRIVLQVLVNAVALWIAAWILPGLAVANTGTSGLETSNATVNTVLAFIFIGLIFGVVNAVVKPVVKILALPVTILTLGLFTIVINAAMLELVAMLLHGFNVTSFWAAILGSIVVSIVSWIGSWFIDSATRQAS